MKFRLLFFYALSVVLFGQSLSANPNLELVEFPGSVFLVSDEECGIVVQKDKDSGKLLKTIRFYRVFPGTETWFTHFFKVGNEIWARDDKERFYKMDAKSLKPKRVELTEAEFRAKRVRTARVGE